MTIPSVRPPLQIGEVHLWWCAKQSTTRPKRREYLDQLLRHTLAPYVEQRPETLCFERTPKGRPYLTNLVDPIDFNLSDTQDGTIIAIARGLSIGVDLERLDRPLQVQALAQRYFCKDEADALAMLDDTAAHHAFLYFWTAKEACCKALGTGIYGQLDQWKFALDRIETSPQVQCVPSAAGKASTWHLHRSTPAPGYTAVVAAYGAIHNIRLFESHLSSLIATYSA